MKNSSYTTRGPRTHTPAAAANEPLRDGGRGREPRNSALVMHCTARQKRAWLKAAGGRPLAAWVAETLDAAASSRKPGSGGGSAEQLRRELEEQQSRFARAQANEPDWVGEV